MENLSILYIYSYYLIYFIKVANSIVGANLKETNLQEWAFMGK